MLTAFKSSTIARRNLAVRTKKKVKHVHNFVPRALLPPALEKVPWGRGWAKADKPKRQSNINDISFYFRYQKFPIFKPCFPSYLFLLLQMGSFGLLGYFLDQ